MTKPCTPVPCPSFDERSLTVEGVCDCADGIVWAHRDTAWGNPWGKTTCPVHGQAVIERIAARDRATNGLGRLGVIHLCDERCVCPLHQTPLLYSPVEALHACQNPDCAFAHGLENSLRETMPVHPLWNPDGAP